MVSTIAVSSIGLATLEMILVYKLSRYSGITGEYAASIVGYNMIAVITLYSALTPSFVLYTTPIALGLVILCFLGISAIAVDGLMPPTGNQHVDMGIKWMVKAGVAFAILSVLLLAFPMEVAPHHQI